MRQSSLNARQASELSEKAQTCAQKGNVSMRHLREAIETMKDSSLRISKIVKVIDDIAFQTNILALNAAVEAARAGQHGKGFAVVADEVKILAARSAAEALRTSELIEETMNRMIQSTEIANETAEAFEDIVNAVEKSTALVEDMAVSSQVQTSGIMMVRQGIDSVSQIVQSNTASAEESAAASQQLSEQAEFLMEMVGRFQIENRIEILPDSNAIKLLGKPINNERICS